MSVSVKKNSRQLVDVHGDDRAIAQCRGADEHLRDPKKTHAVHRRRVRFLHLRSLDLIPRPRN